MAITATVGSGFLRIKQREQMTKEEIIKEFKKAGINFDPGQSNYIDDSFTPVVDLVEKLVKNCSIPDVVGRSEQYCDHAVTDQKTLRCTCCEECGEILDVLD